MSEKDRAWLDTYHRAYGPKVSDDYTPTTEDVRHGFVMRGDSINHGVRAAGFNRWLAAHEAEVRADQREKDARIVETVEWRTYSLEAIVDLTAATIARHRQEDVAAAIRVQSDTQRVNSEAVDRG